MRVIELLGIAGAAGLAFLGIETAKGSKALGVAVAVVVSLGLIFLNAKWEDETGKGIINTIYCSLVTCKSGAVPPTGDMSAGNTMTTEQRPVEPSLPEQAPLTQASAPGPAAVLQSGHWEGGRDWGPIRLPAPTRAYAMNFAPGSISAQDNDGDCTNSVTFENGLITIGYPGGTRLVGTVSDDGRRVDGQRFDSAGRETGRFYLVYWDSNSALRNCGTTPLAH